MFSTFEIPDAVAEQITCPVLTIHGNKDLAVSLQQSQELMKHLKKTDLLEIIRGADHDYSEQNALERATMLLGIFMKGALR